MSIHSVLCPELFVSVSKYLRARNNQFGHPLDQDKGPLVEVSLRPFNGGNKCKDYTNIFQFSVSGPKFVPPE